jgi:hypothetical protein
MRCKMHLGYFRKMLRMTTVASCTMYDTLVLTSQSCHPQRLSVIQRLSVRVFREMVRSWRGAVREKCMRGFEGLMKVV